VVAGAGARDAVFAPCSAGHTAGARQRTIDSLCQQLHTYREEITRLRGQITDLHEQLARQLGDALYRFKTRRKPVELRFAMVGGVGQDRGSCLPICST
jgi:hypothetical protein